MKSTTSSGLFKIIILSAISLHCFAETITGNFFTVAGNGNAINATIRLCLNGYVPASCQEFPVVGEQ